MNQQNLIARRGFLKISSLAGAAAFQGTALRSSSTAAVPEISAASLPAGHFFGDSVTGMARDAQGLVYVAHKGGPGAVFVFDAAGKFVRSLAPWHVGEGQGIRIRKEGDLEFVYLTATGRGPNGGASKMTLAGEKVWSLPVAQLGKGRKAAAGRSFAGMAFSPDGGWFLADSFGEHRIHRFDASGGLMLEFGKLGSKAGEFRGPHGLVLDDRSGPSLLAVADRGNHRVQWLKLDGQPVREVAVPACPVSLTVWRKYLLVACLSGVVVVMDAEGKIAQTLGKPLTIPDLTPHHFGKGLQPLDVLLDNDGTVRVLQWMTGMAVIRPWGKLG